MDSFSIYPNISYNVSKGFSASCGYFIRFKRGFRVLSYFWQYLEEVHLLEVVLSEYFCQGLIRKARFIFIGFSMICSFKWTSTKDVILSTFER